MSTRNRTVYSSGSAATGAYQEEQKALGDTRERCEAGCRRDPQRTTDHIKLDRIGCERKNTALNWIPDWTMSGLIPPIRPGRPGYHPDRSPYRVGLDAFIKKFSTSPERVNILRGLLNYRAELHAVGIVDGFQWLDGSFLECIEDREDRPPRDIDVVTFFNLPSGQTQSSMLPAIQHLIDRTASKAQFSVDGFAVVLGTPLNGTSVQQTCYWYSMWSHDRDRNWKGFAQVDLNPDVDLECRLILEEIADGGQT